MNKKNGFTLAEVLITLAIIGIVAAMTIPTLISKYEKKAMEVRFVKVYSTLANAIKMSEIDNGPVRTWGIMKTYPGEDDKYARIFAEYLAPYLKGTKIKYSYNSHWGAYGSLKVTNMKGNRIVNGPISQSIITGDDIIISFGHINWANPLPYMRVDINGKQGPNVLGKDIFHFALNRTNSGDYVLGEYNYYNRTRKEILEESCNKDFDGENRECAAVIIMDNFKILDDYPW